MTRTEAARWLAVELANRLDIREGPAKLQHAFEALAAPEGEREEPYRWTEEALAEAMWRTYYAVPLLSWPTGAMEADSWRACARLAIRGPER